MYRTIINLFSVRYHFLFSAMLLLHFLEACIGAFDLWPVYVHEILFCKTSTPQNIRTLAAFFYGHDVPLGVASRVYSICNPYAENDHVFPYAMGGYYSAFYSRHDSRYMAQYYDVPNSLLMWINGRNHSQLEPVLPDDQGDHCRLLRRSPMESYAALAYSTMNILCREQAFDIMRN